MSAQRTTLDVSALPKHGFDTKTQLWWGNLWLLFIETTMFGGQLFQYSLLRTLDRGRHLASGAWTCILYP